MLPPAFQEHLRPVRPHRDLSEVADLIELCFKDSLDLEGHSYLRYLRRIAQNNQALHWVSNAAELLNGVPVSGLVWEEAGRIVGNLSLIPILHWRRRVYLIANVAVHPDFRGRGIARTLTKAALDYLRQRHVDAVWLQVRDDNPAAIHIYRSLGFEERNRRTTWVCQTKPPEVQLPPGTFLGERLASHWRIQSQWLKRLYPSELEWYLPLHWRLFQPGLWGGLARFFSFEYPNHWTIQRGNHLLAVLTGLFEGGHTTTLWLAAPEAEELDEQAVQGLLVNVLQQGGLQYPFSLNLPAGYAAAAVQSAGFQPQQTLIWMEILIRG